MVFFISTSWTLSKILSSIFLFSFWLECICITYDWQYLECLYIYAAAISKICDFLDGLAFAMPTLKEEEANFHVNMKLSFSSFNCRCEILDIQIVFFFFQLP